MDYRLGQITSWFDDKGFGFIQPDGGGDDVFLHVKEVVPHQRRPRAGDRVRFALIASETDKPRAARVCICGFAWSFVTLCCLSFPLLLCAYGYAAWRQLLPFHPAALLYGLMSVFTILLYYRDKRIALEGQGVRRIPESTLHLFELLGGWPGALLAQIAFRHKRKKLAFQVAYWSIVAIHGLLWAFWLYDPPLPAITGELRLRDALHDFPRVLSRAPTTPTLSSRNQPPPSAKPSPAGHTAIVPTLNNASDAWLVDTPREPILADPSICRTRISANPRSRQLTGTVEAISASRGLLIALPGEIGEKGTVEATTLIDNFHRYFHVGEEVRVAIAQISMQGKEQTIKLLLVEPHPTSGRTHHEKGTP